MNKVIGIISIVLFPIVAFQSCAVGSLGALSDAQMGASGTMGFIFSVCFLIGGLLILVAKDSKGISNTAAAFYMLGFIFASSGSKNFPDLKIWGFVAILFFTLILVPRQFNDFKKAVKQNKEKKKNLDDSK